jgi:phosphatidylglycerol---prolipoprotein diacylglyceryl transferase
VQLYGSATMAVFALIYVVGVRRGSRFLIVNGFYVAVGVYGLQRFAWEFLKPYAAIVGPFTLFHLLSAALVVYAVAMIVTAHKPRAADDRAFA